MKQAIGFVDANGSAARGERLDHGGAAAAEGVQDEIALVGVLLISPRTTYHGRAPDMRQIPT